MKEHGPKGACYPRLYYGGRESDERAGCGPAPERGEGKRKGGK